MGVLPQLRDTILLVVDLQQAGIATLEKRERLLEFVAEASGDCISKGTFADFEEIGAWHIAIRQILVA